MLIAKLLLRMHRIVGSEYCQENLAPTFCFRTRCFLFIIQCFSFTIQLLCGFSEDWRMVLKFSCVKRRTSLWYCLSIQTYMSLPELFSVHLHEFGDNIATRRVMHCLTLVQECYLPVLGMHLSPQLTTAIFTLLNEHSNVTAWKTLILQPRFLGDRLLSVPCMSDCLQRWCIVAKRLDGSRWNLASR